jgi:hypothetical protein
MTPMIFLTPLRLLQFRQEQSSRVEECCDALTPVQYQAVLSVPRGIAGDDAHGASQKSQSIEYASGGERRPQLDGSLERSNDAR